MIGHVSCSKMAASIDESYRGNAFSFYISLTLSVNLTLM